MKSSKMKNEKASIEEQIKIAVLSSSINDDADTNIDTSILETELKEIKGISIEKQGDKGSLPWTVSVKEFKFQIKEDGTIESVDNGIYLSQTKLKMVEGQGSVKITATLEKGITGTITWTSSNTNLVTVTSGTVDVVGTSGTALITAKVVDEITKKEYSAVCQVDIAQKVTEILSEDLTIEKGKKQRLNITSKPTGMIEDLEYSSSDTSKVIVNENGEVTGVSSGEAIITISGKISTNVSTTCKVTVESKKKYVTVEKIEENPKEYYGKEVLNYGDGKWRLFYCDLEGEFGIEKSVFLIHSNVGNSKLAGLSQYTIDDDSTDSTQLKSIKWLNEHLNNEWCKIGTIDNKYKINVLKELLSTKGAWYNANLIDGEHQIEYVIGAPTIELYVNSYNKTHDSDITFNVPSNDGYTTVTNLTEFNETGIYLFDGNVETYIASPYAYNKNSIATVRSNAIGRLYLASSSKPGKFPIVCLSDFMPAFEEAE